MSTLSDIQFMMLSPNSADDIELKLDENITLRSEKSVKSLGVCIDNRLTFSDHISACCLKAARQRNASTRISKYLDPKSKRIIYNIFIRSNFDYCPLAWHSCWKTDDNKLEKVQERSLEIQWAIISRITKQKWIYHATSPRNKATAFWHTHLSMAWMQNAFITLSNAIDQIHTIFPQVDSTRTP